MSQVYSTEPQTSGRVILETTHGPLEIQLWSRECPATTRFFLQLCLDGFYDKMVFHRVVPNFLIQTGALRHGINNASADENSKGPVDIYRKRVNANQAWDRRTYELNSRIRFNHRGQVAMALDINDDYHDLPLMQPQFFITLDEAAHLDGKHVVFGTVSGPTVFNALRIGRTDVDEETNQPAIMEEAPRIERVKILENSIHTDIVPSEVIPWRTNNSSEKDKPKKKKKRKGVKNLNVLSFGGEFEDEGMNGGGIKSSHDVIQSKILSKEIDKGLEKTLGGGEEKSTRRKEKFDKTKKPQEVKSLEKLKENKGSNMPSQSADRIPQLESRDYEVKIPTKEQIVDAMDTPDMSMVTKKEKPKKSKMSFLEARRAKYTIKGSKDKRKRQEDTMAKLMVFQKKVKKKISVGDADADDGDDGLASRMSRQSRAEERREKGKEAGNSGVSYHGQVLENDEDVKGDWMNTQFKCRKHMDHDSKLGGDGRSALDDYRVIDENNQGSAVRHRDESRHRKRHRRSH